MKTPTKADLARALVREFPDAPSKTLARRLYNENKLLFSNLDAARSAVRYVRGNRGDHARKKIKDKSNARPNEQSGWKPKLPPSQAKVWRPFTIKGDFRALSLSDAHVPYHSTKAINAAVSYGKDKDVNLIIVNGDWCDFYSVSRWDKDPSRRNFVDELEQCENSLEWLRHEFPDARIVYKAGNHEERYDKFIWNKAPELWGLSNVRIPAILHLDDYGIEWVTDQRPIKLGKLTILHGHEMPGGMFNPVNQARGQFLKLNSTSLAGHGHRTSHHAEPDWEKTRHVACWSQGCLCDLSPEYARINKWNWGFTYIEAEKNGAFEVMNHTVSSKGEVW